MAEPREPNSMPALGPADFAALFEEQEGVDQVLAAIGWLESTDAEARGSERARAMEAVVLNSTTQLGHELEALIRDCWLAFKEGDTDLAETATGEIWDLLVLRDRLEDVREQLPELFEPQQRDALSAFDLALDRADIWLEELDNARRQMGEQQGKSHRRWWRPSVDESHADWDLPEAADPAHWVPSDEDVAAWQNGELPAQRAAAVARYMDAQPEVEVALAAAGSSRTPTSTEIPMGEAVGERELEGGIRLTFLTVEKPLDAIRLDVPGESGGAVLVLANGEARTMVQRGPTYWLAHLSPDMLIDARVLVVDMQGEVLADLQLEPIPHVPA